MLLSVVTTFNRNDVSAANPNNQIEILLERLIQKVDIMEKNMAKGFDTATRKTSDATREMAEKVRTLKADAIYIATSDEMKSHNIDAEGISRALSNGYHFVGNGYWGGHDDCISKSPLSFSQCVDVCTKKMHAETEWNSLDWSGYDDNNCRCCKGKRGHRANARFVHFRV